MAADGGRSVRSELQRLARSMPRHPSEPESPLRRQRQRRTHHRIDSFGDGVATSPHIDNSDTNSGSPSKKKPKNIHGVIDAPITPASQYHTPRESIHSKRNSAAPSSDDLTELDRLNLKHGWNAYYGMPQSAVYEAARRAGVGMGEREVHAEERYMSIDQRQLDQDGNAAAGVETATEDLGHHVRPIIMPGKSKGKEFQPDEKHATNGRALEVGSDDYREKDKWRDKDSIQHRNGKYEHDEYKRRRKRRRNICLCMAILLVILVIVIPVAVVYGSKHSPEPKTSSSTGSSAPSNGNLHNVSHSSIPKWARGGYLDPFDWYDTLAFNVTFTDAKVGGLYIMGLNDTWDDSTRANDNVPALDEKWDYGGMPFRGINLGGWLSIEPFITPSLFFSYSPEQAVVDEWSLSQHLGPEKAKSTLEEHYSQWVQESTFAEIQAAGFDHVRIPFSYWAVTTYEGDPYVPMVSFRYLLRGIEWARKYGLRVYLDLHGAPGSQNGWNHSGHQGSIGWLNGTDGDVNAQRTIDIHKQLITFFTQPRYKNIIAMYGLVNEPKMTAIPEEKVLAWSKDAIEAIRGNGYQGLLVMGDGFLGLPNWQGKMQGYDGLVLDAHQYAIYDLGLLSLDHYDKVNFACGGWTQQSKNSINPATGFGPTMVGEWAQADTDCAEFLNGVGVGSRWAGTLDATDTPGGATTGSVTTPQCPVGTKSKCSCRPTYANPSSYSDKYKKWLLTFAEAQMYSFEYGWGWFYWTWKTESAPQWSYKDGIAAGILPRTAYKRSWNCNMSIPDFSGEGLPEWY